MLLLSRILSSGPRAEAGTAGTGSGIKTSSGASGNGLGWTAGIWGATMAGVEVGRTLVEQVFLGTALLTRIGTRRCSLWQDCLGTSSHLVRGSDWQIIGDLPGVGLLHVLALVVGNVLARSVDW